jgi:hypothetical protein
MALALIVFLGFFIVVPAGGQESKNAKVVVSPGTKLARSRLLTGQDVVFSGLAARDLIVIADNADIQGTVSGDLTVLAVKAKIRGHVKGSLTVLGGAISLEGPVDGGVCVFSTGLDFSGKVGRSLKAACINYTSTQASAIGMDLASASVTSQIGGRIGESLHAVASSVSLSSLIGEDVNLLAATDVVVEPQTDVRGNFRYKSPKQFNRKEGSSISGKVEHEILALPKGQEELKEQVTQAFRNAVLFVKVFSVIALILSAILLALFFPGLAEKVSGQIIRNPFRIFLQGLLIYIIVPLACLLLFITLFGIPLALSAGLFYLGALYLAQVFAGIAAGECFIRLSRFRGEGESLPPSRGKVFLAALLGSVFLSVVMLIPHGIGFAISMLSCFWGLGGMSGAGARLCR